MLSDAELVRCEYLIIACKRGSETAMTDLVRMFERPLIYYLRQLTGSEVDAWDLLQDTWLQVFRHMRSVKDGRAFPAYIYRTARNAALMSLRKRKADTALVSAVDHPVEAHDAAVDIGAEEAEAVHAALSGLALAHREVLTLFFLQDLAIDDIAGVLDVPAGTVKSRLHYAKKALREELEEKRSSQ